MVDIASVKGGNKDDKKSAPKAVKFKLTKEQTAYVDNFVTLNNRIAVCREYINLWTGYFRFLADDITQREIRPEDEKGFFQIGTQLARKHFQFVELMGDCFERGPDILNLLCTGTSLSLLQGMQENTLNKFQLDWHQLFLDMYKALGRLLRLMPGNMTLSEAMASLDKAPAPAAAAPAGKAAPAAAAKK